MKDEKNHEHKDFTPVDLRGHKTQDDFEYSEDFGLAIFTESSGLQMIDPQKDDFPYKGKDKGCSCFTWQPEE